MPKKKQPEKTEVLPPKPVPEEEEKRQVVDGLLQGEFVLTEDSDAARELSNQSRYGSIENSRVCLSLIEALFLLEKGKLAIKDRRRHQMTYQEFLRRAIRTEPNFWVRYCVYRDIRGRGYIVKTALKFGADFRVYDRGVKPGEDHAKWVVFPVHEGSTMTWYEFSAKNRVAHSTKKRLLIGCVDAEQDVTYWEIKWVRP